MRLKNGGLPGTDVATIGAIVPGGMYVTPFWRRADGTEWESGSAMRDLEAVTGDEAK